MCFTQERGDWPLSAPAAGGRSVPAAGRGMLHQPATFPYIRRSTATKGTVFLANSPFSALVSPEMPSRRLASPGRGHDYKGARRRGVCLSSAHQGTAPSVLPTLFVEHTPRKNTVQEGWCGSNDVAWNSSGVSRAPLALPPARPAGKALGGEGKATFNKGDYYNYVATMVLGSYMWCEFHCERLQSAAGLVLLGSCSRWGN